MLPIPAKPNAFDLESVGRGAVLMLNLPPDRRGRVHDLDIQSLTEWKGILDGAFSVNLAAGSSIVGSNVRGSSEQFAAVNALDGDGKTYWATDDAVTDAELIVELRTRTTFNVLQIREYIQLGHRINSLTVDEWLDGSWAPWGTATSIGYQRLLHLNPVSTDRVRIRVSGPACVAISAIGMYLLNAPDSEPVITPGVEASFRTSSRRRHSEPCCSSSQLRGDTSELRQPVLRI